MKAIQNDYSHSKKIQKSQTNEKLEENNSTNKFKIQEIKSAEKLWFSQMSVFVESMSKEENENLKSRFLESVEGNVFFKKVHETKGFEDKIIQIQRYKFVEIEKAEEINNDPSASD